MLKRFLLHLRNTATEQARLGLVSCTHASPCGPQLPLGWARYKNWTGPSFVLEAEEGCAIYLSPAALVYDVDELKEQQEEEAKDHENPAKSD